MSQLWRERDRERESVQTGTASCKAQIFSKACRFGDKDVD